MSVHTAFSFSTVGSLITYNNAQQCYVLLCCMLTVFVLYCVTLHCIVLYCIPLLADVNSSSRSLYVVARPSSAGLSVLAALCKLKFGGPCWWPRSNQCQLKHIPLNTWRVETEVRTHKLTQVTWYITKYSCTNEITHSEFMHPALAENK